MMRTLRRSLALGFTMIELVVVVVLLGVLAATVLPKFVDLSDSAYRAVGADANGSLRAGQAFFPTSQMVRRPSSISTVLATRFPPTG